MPVPDMPARGGTLPGQAHGMKPSPPALRRRVRRAHAVRGAGTTPSMLGKWEIVEAAPAPMDRPDRQAALVAEGKRMLKLVITFGPKDAEILAQALTCKRGVIYEPNDLEVDAMFEGNLPEPNPAAAGARLGFPERDIPGVDVRCLKAPLHFPLPRSQHRDDDAQQRDLHAQAAVNAGQPPYRAHPAAA